MHESRHISVKIAKPFAAVNDFLAEPRNFQKWASGLGKGFKRADGEWIVDAPEGAVKVRFTPKNSLGVADHYVMPNPQLEIYIPLRVIANGEGSEVIVTLLRQPAMSDTKFAEDASWVERDLEILKQVLEERP